MKMLYFLTALLGAFCVLLPAVQSEPMPMSRTAVSPWPKAVHAAIVEAGPNAEQIKTALQTVSAAQRPGMIFLVENMPPSDLQTLTAQYLLTQTALAYQARASAPWGASLPEATFLNDVLPYACLNEERDDSRAMLRAKCLPLIAGCQTPGDAAMRLNETLYKLVNVHYSTERQRPDQNPTQTIASGLASCTGLSILLADACRSVGVPARLVGTPLWANNSGNHTWVEVWDNGGWHFLGASEPDAQGLDHAWFTGNASQASNPDHAIYAASFQKTGLHFPLVWDMENVSVPAVNVTDRYAKPEATIPAGDFRLLVRVLDSQGKRVEAAVMVRETTPSAQSWSGKSKGETADLNNVLSFDLPLAGTYDVTAAYQGRIVAQETKSPENAHETALTLTLPMAAAFRSVAADCAVRPLRPAQKTALRTALLAYFSADAFQQAAWKFSANLQRLLLQSEPEVRAIAWDAYKAALTHAQMKRDFDAKQVTFGSYLSPYTLKYVGKRPANGWPLIIAMHGGGGAPKAVNDEQWGEMQIYYKDHPEVGGYEYLALRAPNDTWNGFYDVYVYPLVLNLVKQFLLYGDIDPNKVILMGYSHGGYGAFCIGPKEPDLFAAVHASAAAPTDGETTPVTLRHTVFGVMVGTLDTMYGRYDRDQKFAAEVAALKGNRTDIYPVTVDFQEGYHHSDLPDRDLIPSLYLNIRNPVPHDLTWLMTDNVITDFFWLQDDSPGKTEEIDAACDANHVTVTTTPNVTSATVLLDSRLVDLRQSVTLTVNGTTTVQKATPSLKVLCDTLLRRGDPNRAFTVAIPLPLAPPPHK